MIKNTNIHLLKYLLYQRISFPGLLYCNLNSHTKVEENNTITNFEFDNLVTYSYI